VVPLPVLGRLFLTHQTRKLPPPYRRRIVRACISAYYRTVDRLFGGDRYLCYLKLSVELADQRQAEARASDGRLRMYAGVNFELRLLQEALQNPNFVSTPHTHQDR